MAKKEKDDAAQIRTQQGPSSSSGQARTESEDPSIQHVQDNESREPIAGPSNQPLEDNLQRPSSPIAGPSNQPLDDPEPRTSSPVAGPSNENFDPNSQADHEKPIPFLNSKQILQNDILKMHIEKIGFQTQKNLN